METTGSVCVYHCFCTRNTGGNPICCRCGTVLITLQEFMTNASIGAAPAVQVTIQIDGAAPTAQEPKG